MSGSGVAVASMASAAVAAVRPAGYVGMPGAVSDAVTR